ncbi:IclR family transcriptional regulator [Desulfosoma sp.]|uniref:IclR family transcriptional regulator n=1 Tax=Desulfosoma sp. TaxID=2603217 RepID=UPI00404AF2A0
MMPKVPTPDDGSRTFIQSLARGMAVLEVLSQCERPLNLTELAEAVGLNKVTVSRFCYTWVRLGYVHRTPDKHYHLAPKVLSLGYGALCRMDIRQVGEPYLQELSRTLGETVNMAVRDGIEILYVDRYVTEPIMKHPLHIGARLPLHCTSMGKAILAFLPAKERNEVLTNLPLHIVTHRTITTLEALQWELDQVRRQGYALNDEELSVGLRSIAVPVLKHGQPVAAVNVAVSTSRYTVEALVERCLPALKETVRTISDLLAKQVPVRRVHRRSEGE